MKKYFKYAYPAVAAIMALSLAACDEDDDYTPAAQEQGQQIYFSSEASTSIIASSAETSVSIPVCRVVTTDAVTVPIAVTNEKGDFEVPTSVSFAAGQNKADLVLTYDPEKVGFDNYSTITVTIADEQNTTVYGSSTFTFTVGIPAPWTSLGKAQFNETWWSGATYNVELQQNDLDGQRYRLVKPFADKGSYVDGAEYFEFRIYKAGETLAGQVLAQDIVYYDATPMTYYANYDAVINIEHPSAGFSATKDQSTWVYNSVTYKEDGTPGMVQVAPFFYMEGIGGWNQSQKDGIITIVFPGYRVLDYSAEVAYTGKLYDVDDNMYIQAEVVALGADVEEVLLAVAPADDVNAMVEALATGACADAVKLTAAGTASLPMDPASASGKYSIVAVTFGEGEAQAAVAVDFKYTSLNGEPEESWTAYYVGTYTYEYIWEGDDEGLVLYGSDDNEIRCKIDDWGTGTSFIFNWDEEDNIVVEADQDMELYDSSYGNFYVSDMTAICPLVDGERAWGEVLQAYFPESCDGSESQTSTLDWDNYTFNFDVVYYTDEGQVMGWGFEKFVLTGNASAPARRAAVRGGNVYQQLPKASHNSHINWLKEPLKLRTKPQAFGK